MATAPLSSVPGSRRNRPPNNPGGPAGTTKGSAVTAPAPSGVKKGVGIDVTAPRSSIGTVRPGDALVAAAQHRQLQAQAAAFTHPQSLPQGYDSQFGAGGAGQPLGPVSAPSHGNVERQATPNMLPRRRPSVRSGAAIARG